MTQAGSGETFEHPIDKRPCAVCRAQPKVMKASAVEGVMLCVRCHTPYTVVDPDGQQLNVIDSTLSPDVLAFATSSWSAEGHLIFVRPWMPKDWPRYETLRAAAKAGGRMGDYQVSSFELALELQKATWVTRQSRDAATEVFTVVGEDRAAHWIRANNLQDDHSPEFGRIVILPEELPPGTEITIRKPASW